ncbi:D12 class N6 adenine-specific DNA methyltransferase [Clavibacter michiganensis subsp. michiganensis]|uniref:DNA adenine methylase n=1 Tax=Clavibacter michiganensis TaxID=28447 RepID=UPI000A36109E|nr:DNA adenine methylase [Clavibacter michiganensis]OUE03255.1 D12 class N6 adenine-specific DNA methyltransferase [Clavibacter michiganensis subsp. michiganensis]
MDTVLNIAASRRYGTLSPLRYPGGKASLAGLFADLIATLGLAGAKYVEPYAGGAGAGVALLREGVVDELVINDFDPAVHAFWHSVVHSNEDFLQMLDFTPVTIPEWLRQREIYRARDTSNLLSLGFAFFYLNRTNRSGVLTGGVIGGLNQAGTYKIDARFNKSMLRARIAALGALADQITVTDYDGRTVIRDYDNNPNVFMYIDPPYVGAGSRLYLNAFDARDHTNLASMISGITQTHWLMTYDVTPLVTSLYRNFHVRKYDLNYSAHHPGRASELMITSPSVHEAIASSVCAVSA